LKIISSLKKEFNISDLEIEGFITTIINKTIEEHMGEANSKVFSQAETEEIEDDLKGLGYI
jgi:exoribonuclease R